MNTQQKAIGPGFLDKVMGSERCGPAGGTVRGGWSDEGPVERCWSFYGEVG